MWGKTYMEVSFTGLSGLHIHSNQMFKNNIASLFNRTNPICLKSPASTPVERHVIANLQHFGLLWFN